jgi:hypothetical protein
MLLSVQVWENGRRIARTVLPFAIAIADVAERAAFLFMDSSGLGLRLRYRDVLPQREID